MDDDKKKKSVISYKDSGVDIDKAAKAIGMFKNKVLSTFSSSVLNDLASYAGLFQINTNDFQAPVLVSSTDGVGTKILLAVMEKDFSTIGQDLVAMCVNDIICCGAKPLFFLDYLACGKLEPDKIKKVVESIAEGCILAEAALIGGETAEMPGIYSGEDIDLAGFAVGIVDRKKIFTKDRVKEGDIICAVSSSGPHSNGYSLIRKIISENNLDLKKDYGIAGYENKSLGKILLTPTKIYVRAFKSLIQSGRINGLAHITGGGFYENINRIIPQNCNAVIDSKAWKVPAIFEFLQKKGCISQKEMYRVFNMGIGMAIILRRQDIKTASEILLENHEQLLEIGKITSGNGIVEVI